VRLEHSDDRGNHPTVPLMGGADRDGGTLGLNGLRPFRWRIAVLGCRGSPSEQTPQGS
jgi:hypothetical protein